MMIFFNFKNKTIFIKTIPAKISANNFIICTIYPFKALRNRVPYIGKNIGKKNVMIVHLIYILKFE